MCRLVKRQGRREQDRTERLGHAGPGPHYTIPYSSTDGQWVESFMIVVYLDVLLTLTSVGIATAAVLAVVAVTMVVVRSMLAIWRFLT